jgi:hypothetical protein
MKTGNGGCRYPSPTPSGKGKVNPVTLLLVPCYRLLLFVVFHFLELGIHDIFICLVR